MLQVFNNLRFSKQAKEGISIIIEKCDKRFDDDLTTRQSAMLSKTPSPRPLRKPYHSQMRNVTAIAVIL